MSKYKNKYRTETTRLKNWDYSSPGSYFVTICTKNREYYFGDIVPFFGDEFVEKIINAGPVVGPIVETQYFASLQSGQQIYQHHYTQMGKTALEYWREIPSHFDFVELDEFVIMPNHIHGIINIKNHGYKKWEPNKFGPQSKNLGSIIRGFKAAVTTESTIKNLEFKWQSRYYDNILWTENDLNRVRNYIRNNPINWVKKHNSYKS